MNRELYFRFATRCPEIFRLIVLLSLAGFPTLASATAGDPPPRFTVTVDAGEYDRTNSIVIIPLTAGQDWETVELVGEDGQKIIGQGLWFYQITGTESKRDTRRQLAFVIPELAARVKRKYKVVPVTEPTGTRFEWQDNEGGEATLRFGDRPMLKYMHERVDHSSEQRRQETFKPWHHVYSPDGSRLLTKGPGGLYPHHRGIFFGFNRISFAGQTADTWHCTELASQIHLKSNVKLGGAFVGRDVNIIQWNGRDGDAFAEETRMLTVFNMPDGTLIEFESRLKSLGSRITLDGDPQHAGVQFRASQKVAEETASNTFYIRPDGVGKPGEFRNWSGGADETEINKAHKNLPWNAMCFQIDDHPYTCCYLDHPDNPKPAMFSERDYGRFGSYFKHVLEPEEPLTVRYRFWLQDEQISIAMANRLSHDFVSPVKAFIEQ